MIFASSPSCSCGCCAAEQTSPSGALLLCLKHWSNLPISTKVSGCGLSQKAPKSHTFTSFLSSGLGGRTSRVKVEIHGLWERVYKPKKKRKKTPSDGKQPHLTSAHWVPKIATQPGFLLGFYCWAWTMCSGISLGPAVPAVSPPCPCAPPACLCWAVSMLLFTRPNHSPYCEVYPSQNQHNTGIFWYTRWNLSVCL